MRRHLTIAHVMVLTLGIALSLSVWRSYCLDNRHLDMQTQEFRRIYLFSTSVVLMLIPPSLMLLPLGLRGTSRRRLRDDPAFNVSFTVLLLCIYRLASAAPQAAVFNNTYLDPGFHMAICRPLGVEIGILLAVSWIIQAVSGRTRWPRDGVGMVGVILGACWIVFTVLTTVIQAAPYVF